MGSLYTAECGIPMELKAKVVDAHSEFFKTTGNRQKIATRLSSGMDVKAIEKQMLSIVCKNRAYIRCSNIRISQRNIGR